MKNFLILGLTALLLFSISAALSLWLNQGRTTTDTSPSTEKSSRKAGSDKDKTDKDTEPHSKRNESRDEGPVGAGPNSLAILRDQERRIELRTEEVNLVMRDILAQREVIDGLVRQVMVELRNAEGKVNDLEVRQAELEKKKVEFDTAERRNIERIAGLMDAMSPESAAATLKQMADGGKLEVAAKVLATMKDRNAARALGELADPALAAQLLDKMRMLKGSTVPQPPKSGVPGGNAPGGGAPQTPRSPAP
jgi:cytoskeletal protein RodZ